VPKSPFFSGSAHAIGRHRTWQNLRPGAVTHALRAFAHVTGRECIQNVEERSHSATVNTRKDCLFELEGGTAMKLSDRRTFLRLAAGAAALPAISRIALRNPIRHVPSQ
jgi:hypothetical protein